MIKTYCSFLRKNNWKTNNARKITELNTLKNESEELISFPNSSVYYSFKEIIEQSLPFRFTEFKEISLLTNINKVTEIIPKEFDSVKYFKHLNTINTFIKSNMYKFTIEDYRKVFELRYICSISKVIIKNQYLVEFSFSNQFFLRNLDEAIQKENYNNPGKVMTLYYMCLFAIWMEQKESFDILANKFATLDPASLDFILMHKEPLFWAHRRVMKLQKLKIIISGLERHCRGIIANYEENKSETKFEQLFALIMICYNSKMNLEFDFLFPVLKIFAQNLDLIDEEKGLTLVNMLLGGTEYLSFPQLKQTLTDLTNNIFLKFPGNTNLIKLHRTYLHLKTNSQSFKPTDFFNLIFKIPEHEIINQHYCLYLLFYCQQNYLKDYSQKDNETNGKLTELYNQLLVKKLPFEKGKIVPVFDGVSVFDCSFNRQEQRAYEISDAFTDLGLNFVSEFRFEVYYYDFHFPDFYEWILKNQKHMKFKSDFFRDFETLKDYKFVLEINGVFHYDYYFTFENYNSKFKESLMKYEKLFVLKLRHSHIFELRKSENPNKYFYNMLSDMLEYSMFKKLQELRKRKFGLIKK